MNGNFCAAESMMEYVVDYMTGVESLAHQMRENHSISSIQGCEAYAASVLRTNGMKLKEIDGVENFIKKALYNVVGALNWVGLRVYQYWYIVDRFIVSKVSTAIHKYSLKQRNGTELAKESSYSPERIVQIIKDPKAEKDKVKKLEELAEKGVEDTHGFKLPETALYHVIGLAEKSSSNANTVDEAIKVAGSIDKLLSKHKGIGNDIEIDTQAFVKLYDTLSKDRETTIDNIMSFIDNAQSILDDAQKEIGSDLFLALYPSQLKKQFQITKGFKGDISILDAVFLKGLLKTMQVEAKKLEKFVETAKGDEDKLEDKVTAAAKLLKVYTQIVELLMSYYSRVNKAEIYAQRVCAEALYKIIIASAKAELGK